MLHCSICGAEIPNWSDEWQCSTQCKFIDLVTNAMGIEAVSEFMKYIKNKLIPLMIKHDRIYDDTSIEGEQSEE